MLGGIEVVVVVGRSDWLLARGLVDVLREDQRLSVSAGDVAHGVPECTGAARRVVIVHESAGRPGWIRSRRAVGACAVLAREPTCLFGMSLLAARVSCLDMASPQEAVLAAIVFVAEGHCVFESGEQRIELTRDDAPILTSRELDVLAGLSEGRSRAEIALRLEISVETVKKHSAKLLRKLQARNTREFVGLPTDWLVDTPITQNAHLRSALDRHASEFCHPLYR